MKASMHDLGSMLRFVASAGWLPFITIIVWAASIAHSGFLHM